MTPVTRPLVARPLGCLVALAASIAVSTPGLAAPTPSLAAPTAGLAAATGYFKSSLNSDIYRVNGYNTSAATVQKLTLDEWARAGYPRPTVLRPTFDKYSWSSDVYAVMRLGTQHSAWVTTRLTLADWQRAGSPAPRTVAWIDGTLFYTLSSNRSEIFARLNSTYHKLTFAEWTAAGSPRPTPYADAVARLTWQDNIGAFPSGVSGPATLYTFALWRDAGFPTPARYQRFPGDAFARMCNSSDVYYFGPTFTGRVTLQQWLAAGAPAPQVQGTC